MRNSVVITTYNGKKYIIEQLQSIKNQTLPPEEVIIRDDGSTDGTHEIVAQYIKDNGLGWDFRVNKKNKGFYLNFLDAIRDCTGDVIYLADQDDVWDLNKIKTFTTFYEKQPEITMIQSNYRFIDGDGMSLPVKELYHGKKTQKSPILLSTLDMFKFAGSGYTMSFRKCVSDKIFETGFDNMQDVFVYHDLLLGQMATALGDCYMISWIVDAHRLHSSNQTQQKGKSFIAERTKKVQTDILKRRLKQCCLMKAIAETKETKEVIAKFRHFTKGRLNLVDESRLKMVFYLFKHRNMYASKIGIITDFMYCIGQEKVLLFLYNKCI